MRFPLIHSRHFGLEILIFKLIVDSFFQQILTSNIKIQDIEVRNCVFFRFIKCFRCIESPLQISSSVETAVNSMVELH